MSHYPVFGGLYIVSSSKPAWRIVSEQIYERFKIFQVKKSTRINPRTHSAVDFLLLDGLDWVNLIALTPDNQVVLVKQYRHGAEEYTLEIPGGCVEEGEDPMRSALRELREETGYNSTEIEHLGTVHPNPAMLSMRCHSYLARNVKKEGALQLDPGEDITVEIVPLAQALQLVKDGTITHALVVAAFGLFKLKN